MGSLENALVLKRPETLPGTLGFVHHHPSPVIHEGVEGGSSLCHPTFLRKETHMGAPRSKRCIKPASDAAFPLQEGM